MNVPRWRFSIDVGGTFTDCLAVSPSGKTFRQKVLSSARIRTSANVIAGSSNHLRLNLPWDTGNDFFRGYQCTLLDEGGTTVGQYPATKWDPISNTLTVDKPVISPNHFTSVELAADQPAPILVMRLILQLRMDQPLPPLDLRLGTTRGTNALLTRNGATTGFVTTAGFADALSIGNQQRPDLFAVDVKKFPVLYQHSAEIAERIASDGTILMPMIDSAVYEVLRQLKHKGVQSLAICLLNSYKNPEHELRLAAIAQAIGFANISLSHQVSPLIKFVPRACTTVLDAYLNPVLDHYLRTIRSHLAAGSQMLMMTSSGGLVTPERFSGKDSILSGPAGGAIGFATAAKNAGFRTAIGFDMGGTSTDVSRLNNGLSLQTETRKAGIDIQTPTLAIETVAAGGGSVCWFDGNRMLVGPQSAGSDPGPACYGRGGPLTVTDMNVWLGRVPSDRFPLPLQINEIHTKLVAIIDEIYKGTRTKYATNELALAFLEIANSHMASAIHSITTQQGVDPQDYPLVAFGGAAAQNACGVAELLGMSKILLHPDAGLLSAFGIQHSRISRVAQAPILRPLDLPSIRELPKEIVRLAAQASSELPQTFSGQTQTVTRIHLCVHGTEQSLAITAPGNVLSMEISELEAEIREQFWQAYSQRFGYRQDRLLYLELLEVEVSLAQQLTANLNRDPTEDSHNVFDSQSNPNANTRAWKTSSSTGDWHEDPCGKVQYRDRENWNHTEELSGPIVVAEAYSTIFIAEGWNGNILKDGQVLLTKSTSGMNQASTYAADLNCDPHRLELFNHRLTQVATQMGLTLQATCTSVNVKERLDFSCAVFDQDGDLIVNAPHIPVHLGAMSLTVKSTIAANTYIMPGDVFVTNDPFQGGSHLPDVTVISPVFIQCTDRPEAPLDEKADSARIEKPRFWVASRAHHSEIGGITPGSMPPFSKSLEEEGVIIRNFRLLRKGSDHFDQLRALLSGGKYPSRNPTENILDIQSQIAANRLGEKLLQQLVESWSEPVVVAYMQHIQDAAADQTDLAIAKFNPGIYRFEDRLDCGLTIRLAIHIKNKQMVFDFEGTDSPAGNNFNTNPAIVSSAILYCLRLLVDAPIPLNQGVLRSVAVKLPKCFLNPLGDTSNDDLAGIPDAQLPAVVGGNVETSQRIVDTILGALNICAASQGTMNNFLFGNDQFGFYETIGGGTGASQHSGGSDAVHSHMTNTRLTDPEILEVRYPVRLREFSIRKGSGGAGRFCGGNGMIRRFEFLQPLIVSLVTNRRGHRSSELPGSNADDQYLPFGLLGADPGQAGQNLLIDTDGRSQFINASCQIHVKPGQQIEIRTPGGGGWGSPQVDT